MVNSIDSRFEIILIFEADFIKNSFCFKRNFNFFPMIKEINNTYLKEK